MSRWMYPILILNTLLTNMFFLLGKMVGMVWFQTSFILSSRSSYKRCRKDEVVLCRACIGLTHLTHSYILNKYPPPWCEHCQCILTICHILVECNHFAEKKGKIYLVKTNMVKSFRFHPTLILLYFKECQFYTRFLLIYLWLLIYAYLPFNLLCKYHLFDTQ